MLRLDDVSVSIAGAAILQGASLEVPANAFVGLVGRNGAGKTTLMRASMNLPSYTHPMFTRTTSRSITRCCCDP